MPRKLPSVDLYVTFVVIIATSLLVFSASHDPWFATTGQTTIGGLLSFIAIGLGLEFADHRLAMGSSVGSIAFIVYMGAALVFGPTWCALVAAISLIGSHGLH